MTQHRILPPLPARVHFVGIGGIGMSGLARILHAWGYDVSGSDSAASDQTAALAAEGIAVQIGHTATEQAASADLLVMTAAARTENPEITAARSAGVTVIKRAELLGMLANARTCVAVAGSHGKSTTSGMLVAALTTLGMDPSYAVGAVVGLTGTNAAPGQGAAMVVEADEYDRSFHTLLPDVAIVTNIDFDHPDIYEDQAAYDASFRQFLAQVRPGGTAIVAADDPGTRHALTAFVAATGSRIVTFGETDEADWVLADGVVHTPQGERIPLNLAVPGRHNQRNATAAMIALHALGVASSEAARALGSFSGVGRRFDLKGEIGGVTVIDDYAHHPTEIAATLAAAAGRYPGRRVWAVFQPHTYSRTKALLDDFARVLPAAETTIVLDIYASRETDSLGVSSDQLVARIPGARLGGSLASAAALLAREVQSGDVVLTMGAGDITAAGPLLLEQLRAQAVR